MQNNYYINYYQGEGEPKKAAPVSTVHQGAVKPQASMEQEELMHRLEELKNENQLNTCFA